MLPKQSKGTLITSELNLLLDLPPHTVYSTQHPSMFQVHWYKGSMKLSDGERHSAVRVAGKRYRLAIAPVLRADFGNYSCVSENGLGKARGPATRVTLTGKLLNPNEPCCLQL